MDDEEVYYGNNQLHQYLSSFDDFAGCYDVIQIHNTADVNIDPPSVVKSAPSLNYSVDNKTLSLVIRKILESGLLLEEDAHYADSFAEPVTKYYRQDYSLSQYKSEFLFLGSAFLASVFFCTRNRTFSVPCSIGVGLGLVTVSCGMWKYQKVRQKQQQVRKCEDMLNALHMLFQVLKKSTQLIQENEIIMRGNILAKSSAISFSALPNHVARGQLLLSLRSAISFTIKNIVCMFTNCTRQLIHSIPLAGQLNFQQSYITTLYSDPVTLLKLSDGLPRQNLRHNHNIYLLLQSQFLKQLALCFCPKLWRHELNMQVQEINFIISTVTHETINLYNNLQKEYMACNLYGMNDKRKTKTFHKSWKYSDIYVATHSAGLHLQAMLLKVREVEDLLEKTSTINENDNFLAKIQDIFDEVIREEDLFDSCCKQSITQIQKLKVVAQECDSGMEKSKLTNLTPEHDGTVQENIFKCENYVVEDEVFEATSCQDDILQEEACSITMLSKEERMQREIERQISWRMVKELKTVLVSKATEWKERERRALLRKAGLDTSSSEKESPFKELPCHIAEWPLPRLKMGLPKKYKSNYSSRRHSTVGFDYSNASNLPNESLTGIAASIPPLNCDILLSEKVSPLKELPCNIGEWPLPRLKKGLPKKYRSNCSSRRHSTIGFECLYSLDDSNVDLSGVEASSSYLKCKSSNCDPSLTDLSPSILPSLPTKSIPPPPPPPPITPSLVLFPSQSTLSLKPTLSHSRSLSEEDNVPGVHENVNEKEVKSTLDGILKEAEHFWNLRKKPIEDTFCGTGENLEEEAGFREGVSAGKDEVFQIGFDNGYGQGYKIGHRLGYVKGLLNAIQMQAQATGLQSACETQDNFHVILEATSKGLCQLCSDTRRPPSSDEDKQASQISSELEEIIKHQQVTATDITENMIASYSKLFTDNGIEIKP